MRAGRRGGQTVCRATRLGPVEQGCLVRPKRADLVVPSGMDHVGVNRSYDVVTALWSCLEFGFQRLVTSSFSDPMTESDVWPRSPMNGLKVVCSYGRLG